MKLEKITAQASFRTPLHLHPQPGIIYVQKETLYCETSDGKSLKVSTGESFPSSQETVHFCENNGDEEMVVFLLPEQVLKAKKQLSQPNKSNVYCLNKKTTIMKGQLAPFTIAWLK
tara:strand:+ start:707 stop:1054 length:348 start_codon:yes stop_codon:yes gene_type:complete